jgi:hypothetical protein
MNDVKQPSETAEAEARFGSAHAEARVKATPAGLLAAGTLVAGILLSVSVLLRSIGRMSRDMPQRKKGK